MLHTAPNAARFMCSSINLQLLQYAGDPQREARDHGAKHAPVGLVHLVGTFHGSDRRRQHRAARVAMDLSRYERRLLADDTGALDLVHLAVAVGDDPVPPAELHDHRSLVLDGHGVRECERALLGGRAILEVACLDGHPDSLRGGGRHGLAYLDAIPDPVKRPTQSESPGPILRYACG